MFLINVIVEIKIKKSNQIGLMLFLLAITIAFAFCERLPNGKAHLAKTLFRAFYPKLVVPGDKYHTITRCSDLLISLVFDYPVEINILCGIPIPLSKNSLKN